MGAVFYGSAALDFLIERCFFLFLFAVGGDILLDHRETIDGGYLDLDQEVETIVCANELLRMVGRLLIRYLQDADRDNVKVVNHQVELAGILLIFVLQVQCLEVQMVELESDVSLDHVHPGLVEHLYGLPEALGSAGSILLNVDFRVESFFLLLEG